MSSLIEVWLDWVDELTLLGHLRRIPNRSGETASFTYARSWREHPKAFAIDPALPLSEGEFYPQSGALFGAIGDSAPDRWGQDLMRYRERRTAQAKGRAPRSLQAIDFLLGVADISRLGAIRFQEEGSECFLAPRTTGVPGVVELGRLLQASDHVQTGSFADEDLRLLLAPGSSLGGARPKASIVDVHGNLMIAKFPKLDDRLDIERWEAIALTLARQAGVDVAPFELKAIGDRHVLLSQRFDRYGVQRLPFISAMALTGHQDGDEDASYLELAEVIATEGAQPQHDREQLFRRIGFSILLSNLDDHLRNHGFIRSRKAGWQLSPAYDLNPVPPHIKPPILSTAITLNDRSADIDLLLETAEDYGLTQRRAREIMREVALATSNWRQTAKRYKAPAIEVDAMAGAFEHVQQEKALKR